jgi:acetyltransferase-like isoleucine patch superfamily enzyme
MPYYLYLFLRWCPGVLGILLRQKMYRWLLRRCGRNVLIGRYVDLKNPRAIVLGNNVMLNDYASLDASQYAGGDIAITIGNEVFIGASTTLTAGQGTITLEENCNIGSGCTLIAKYHNMRIGHHALLAGFCTVGAELAEIPPEPEETISLVGRTTDIQTHLGGGCWLGLRTRVPSGVEIGEGAIVGAHSIVFNSLPAYAISFGQPARVIRYRP